MVASSSLAGRANDNALKARISRSLIGPSGTNHFRGDPFVERRKLMAAWVTFCNAGRRREGHCHRTRQPRMCGTTGPYEPTVITPHDLSCSTQRARSSSPGLAGPNYVTTAIAQVSSKWRGRT
jgi:hypothetical protein